MPWKNKKMNFIVQDPNLGCMPLKDPESEKILQDILTNPSQNLVDLGHKYGHGDTFVYKLLYKDECRARYNWLMSKTAIKAICTRDQIVNGILQETKTAQKSADRLKAWELLGKTMALFTDKIEHTGLPKRLIIRTQNTTEDIGPENAVSE